MLSVNSELTASQVRGLMHASCDKIAGVTYSGGDSGAGGRNDEYGYGRISAFKSVSIAKILYPKAPSAYYKMNEASGTVASDTSGNGITANIVGTAQGGFNSGGYEGNALYSPAMSWNGSWYLSVPNNAGQVIGTSSNTPFTVAAWVKEKGIASGTFESVLATNEVSGASGFRLTIAQNATTQFKIRFYSTLSGGNVLVETPYYIIAPEVWRHVSATYDGTTATIYIDGQAVATGTGNIVGNTQAIRVAAGISGFYTMSGYIDELRFYTRSLSSQEVGILSGQ
jgi:hypothetical protein